MQMSLWRFAESYFGADLIAQACKDWRLAGRSISVKACEERSI
jgi:hypothetical protein